MPRIEGLENITLSATLRMDDDKDHGTTLTPTVSSKLFFLFPRGWANDEMKTKTK